MTRKYERCCSDSVFSNRNKVGSNAETVELQDVRLSYGSLQLFQGPYRLFKASRTIGYLPLAFVNKISLNESRNLIRLESTRRLPFLFISETSRSNVTSSEEDKRWLIDLFTIYFSRT